MSLADTIVSDWNNLVANTNELAETIHFQPEGGGAVREIIAVVTEEGMVVARANIHQRDEVILVSVGRDEDADCGGIGLPTLGDKLWRPSKAYPEDPFNWTGETVDVNPANWTLRYIRTRPYRATARR